LQKQGRDNVASAKCKSQLHFRQDNQLSAFCSNFNKIFSTAHLTPADEQKTPAFANTRTLAAMRFKNLLRDRYYELKACNQIRLDRLPNPDFSIG
jgi:hypothetical protein